MNLLSHPVVHLLTRLVPTGVQFCAAGDELRIKPGRGLSPDQRSAIATYKEGILGLARRVAGTDPVSAHDLLKAALAAPPPTDPEMASWSDDARYVYDERIGVAIDQGMDVSPGSEAEQTARREARRVRAGLPSDWLTTRDSDIFDAALDAFAPLGGLTYLHSEPRKPEGEDAANQQIKGPIE